MFAKRSSVAGNGRCGARATRVCARVNNAAGRAWQSSGGITRSGKIQTRVNVCVRAQRAVCARGRCRRAIEARRGARAVQVTQPAP